MIERSPQWLIRGPLERACLSANLRTFAKPTLRLRRKRYNEPGHKWLDVFFVISFFASFVFTLLHFAGRAFEEYPVEYLLIFVFFYLSPSIIAFIRDHRRTRSIVFVNILLGWTIIGWIAALAAAVSRARRGVPRRTIERLKRRAACRRSR